MSVRRQIRQRKDFLYKRQIDSQQILRDEKKRKLKNAVDERKSIPTEIVAEARVLQHELDTDVIPITDNVNSIDDEYANIGSREPKVFYVYFEEKLSYYVYFVL
jgi:U3 small nucleolar ribonucleoprotein protein IMP4